MPFIIYVALATVIIVKYRKEADKNVLSLLYSIAAVYLSAMLIYGCGGISDLNIKFDYIILKVYVLSSFMPVFFLRHKLFSGNRKRIFIFMIAIVAILLLSVDLFAVTEFKLVSFASVSRAIVLADMGIFIFFFVTVSKFEKELLKSLFGYMSIIAVCNYVYIFYGDVSSYMGYIVAIMCFAGLHVWLSLMVEGKDAPVAYSEKIVKDKDSHLLEEGSVVTHDSGLMYKNPNCPLKERLINYFESEKPFLSKDLTMEEVAMTLFTNKSYLSKTINVEMNKNFRELVNTFRVREAIKLFSRNQEISINELREMSGFNNNASFTSAFKLITGSTPGEWCRNMKNQDSLNRGGDK